MKKIFVFLYLIITTGFSQWSTDHASPLLVGNGIQPQIISSEDGTVYIAWLSPSNFHVYLQKFDAEGYPQFEEGGMLISNYPNSSWIAFFHLNLKIDHENNAILSFVDEREGAWNVYVYKISPNGDFLWGNNGIALSDNYPGLCLSPRFTLMEDNSVIVTWTEDYEKIRGQRISSNGELLWGDGLLIEDASLTYSSPLPIEIDSDEFLLQWIGQSGPVWAPDGQLHLQKFNINGNEIWNSHTVAFGPEQIPSGNWLQQTILNPNGGSYSSWTKTDGNAQSALVQNVSNDGSITWDNPVELSSNSTHFRSSPRIAHSSINNEIYAVWNESNGSQSLRGITAQKLNNNGEKQWGDNGLPVVPLNGNGNYLDVSIHELNGDMVVGYIQSTTFNNNEVSINRLNSNGDIIWNNQNLQITSNGGGKSDLMFHKGNTGFYVVWSQSTGIFVQCLNFDGELGAPINNTLLGDLNNDGEINVIDVLQTVNLILFNEFNSTADLNGDGIVNVVDILLIVNIILGE